MKFTPHPFQIPAIEHADAFLDTATPDSKQGYTSPTGSGKSIMQLELQQRRLAKGKNHWIITPKDEIIVGMLQKLGVEDAEHADSYNYKISTPIRLRNAIMRGDILPPEELTFDEAHHVEANSWEQLHMLTGLAPATAWTATYFRGNPRGTAEFREHWGEPEVVISYEEACAEGIISNPSFSTVPLVDDDIVDISSGEFNVTSIESATVDRLGDAADHIAQYYGTQADGSQGWDMPTMVAMPGTATMVRMHQEMLKRGLPCAYVASGVPKEERWPIFKAVEAGVLALLHINVVSEGVDLRIRRLVDLAPTMSPVKWTQQLGRITRPWDKVPSYVCMNRNLMRHAYILDGAVPTRSLVEAEKVFPQSTRPAVRALGLEAIGRFKPTKFQLVDGLTCQMYTLKVPIERMVVEYVCVVHPRRAPYWFSKVNGTKEDGSRDWGEWRVSDAPSSLRGFGSVGEKALTDKQTAWWERSAVHFGLDPTQKVDKKNFPILPVLVATGVRL